MPKPDPDQRPRGKTKIHGIHPLQEALAAGAVFEKLLLRKGLDTEPVRELVEGMRAQGVSIRRVPENVLSKEAGTDRHQGVLAYVSPIAYTPLEEVVMNCFDRGETPLLLLPVNTTDVRNLGSLARSAECMGAHALLLPAGGRARVNAEAMRTSAGALNHLAVCRLHTLSPAFEFLKHSGIGLVGIHERGGQALWQAEFTGPLCLVLGAEDQGIPYPIRRELDEAYHVPMQGEVDSLNVGVTAGMALYEVARQRLARPM